MKTITVSLVNRQTGEQKIVSRKMVRNNRLHRSALATGVRFRVCYLGDANYEHYRVVSIRRLCRSQ